MGLPSLQIRQGPHPKTITLRKVCLRCRRCKTSMGPAYLKMPLRHVPNFVRNSYAYLVQKVLLFTHCLLAASYTRMSRRTSLCFFDKDIEHVHPPQHKYRSYFCTSGSHAYTTCMHSGVRSAKDVRSNACTHKGTRTYTQ